MVREDREWDDARTRLEKSEKTHFNRLSKAESF